MIKVENVLETSETTELYLDGKDTVHTTYHVRFNLDYRINTNIPEKALEINKHFSKILPELKRLIEERDN